MTNDPSPPPPNPYEPSETLAGERQAGASSGQAAYNIVSDIVVGVNVRGSDNKFQAIFIAVSVLLCAGIGAARVRFQGSWQLPWYGGALIGALAGLVIGLFASGIFLMVYRTVRHLQGKHD